MNKKKLLLFKSVLFLSILFIVIDLIYRLVKNISPINKEDCIINHFLSKNLFFLFENFFELFVIVLVGVFIAVIIENYFFRFKGYLPKNIFSAFLYGSILPICSCTAIPLLYTLKNKMKISVLITFIIAAPMLSPFIIVLSLSTIGIKYTILRIVCAFIIACVCGIVVERFMKKENLKKPKNLKIKCDPSGSCLYNNKNIYEKTYIIYKKIFLYILLAASLGALFELLKTHDFIMQIGLSNHWLAILVVICVGIPLYFCNGLEVLFVKPFLHSGFFGLGTAIGFSLTSTAICISSIVLLFRFLGRKITFVLISTILWLVFVLSVLINFLF